MDSAAAPTGVGVPKEPVAPRVAVKTCSLPPTCCVHTAVAPVGETATSESHARVALTLSGSGTVYAPSAEADIA